MVTRTLLAFPSALATLKHQLLELESALRLLPVQTSSTQSVSTLGTTDTTMASPLQMLELPRFVLQLETTKSLLMVGTLESPSLMKLLNLCRHSIRQRF
jgi:hypothetical protein